MTDTSSPFADLPSLPDYSGDELTPTDEAPTDTAATDDSDTYEGESSGIAAMVGTTTNPPKMSPASATAATPEPEMTPEPEPEPVETTKPDAPTSLEDFTAKYKSAPGYLGEELRNPDITFANAARSLRDAGFRVLPTTSEATDNKPGEDASKNPGSAVGKDWQHKSTVRDDDIDKWFSPTTATPRDIVHPDGFYRPVGAWTINLAIHVGPDHVILDIDNPNDIPAWWWPHLDTAPFHSSSAVDPRRGHYIFRTPEGMTFTGGRIRGAGIDTTHTFHPGDVRDRKGDRKPNPGDIRTGNNIILTAPSHHPKAPEGRRYQWQRVGTIPVLPDEIADGLSKRTTHYNGHVIDFGAADDAKVEAFKTTNNRATVEGVDTDDTTAKQVARLNQEARKGSGLHNTAVGVVFNTVMFARCGYCDAGAALDQLRDAFITLRTDPTSGCNQTDPDSAAHDFDDMVAWAIGKVEAQHTADPLGLQYTADAYAFCYLGARPHLHRPAGFIDDGPDGNTPLIAPSHEAPKAVARLIAGLHYTDPNGHPLLVHHLGTWLRWHDGAWHEIEVGELRKTISDTLEHASVVYDKPKVGPSLKPWNPNKRRVDDVIDSLQATQRLAPGVAAPAWLTTDHTGTRPPAAEYIAVANGLLHTPTRELHEHTPELFNRGALTFDYDPDAGAPTEWLKFLATIWADDGGTLDTEAIALLQEWFGYVLSGHTELQKMLLIQGPKRSGKTTIFRVLQALVGDQNTTAPTLTQLSEQFGLQPLVGMPLALVGDAHIGKNSNTHVITERLKDIVGEGTITAQRKHTTPWVGQLPTRFAMATNNILDLDDASGALQARLLILVMTKSFLGNEDTELLARLLDELPAILSWALDGYEALMARPGHQFTRPDSSQEVITMIDDAANPLALFIRTECELDPAASEPTDGLYAVYKQWCLNRDEPPLAKNIFARRLREGWSQLQQRQHTVSGVRVRVYAGIRLRNVPDPE